MSADLLRRAAKVLRGHVADLPVKVQADWEQDSSEIYTVPEREWVGETLQDGGAEIAYYVVMMHPPVALALAAVLDGLAEAIDGTVGDAAAANIFESEIALARAILREPEATS